MRYGRRSGLVLTAASALCLVSAFGGAAMASPAGSVKGDPQPETAPFKLGNLGASSSASIAMEPNGAMVVVYDIAVGDGRLQVCVIDRGPRKCTSKTVVDMPSGEDTTGSPEVFIPSANHVDVLQAESPGDTQLFSSTNGGKSFGSPVNVGDLDVGAAALVSNNIVFTTGDNGGGAQIESIPVGSPGVEPVTTVNSKTAYDVGVGDYRGGALIGSDYEGPSIETTYVSYAPSGDNFNSQSSYHQVGSFGKEMLVGMSGDALLTVQTQGKEDMLLRLFNGRGFGASHVMPGGAGCTIGCSITIDQDPSGAVHVFIERSAFDYDLVERTTTDGGSKWGGAVNLGNAISDGGFSAALDSRGTGLVIGTGNVLAYPVLGAQGVSLSLSRSSIRKGQTVTASGRVTPHDSGRSVQLQVEVSKNTWRNVTGAKATTKSGGSFSIKIKGNSAGSFTYRAVASDLAGYLLYGYSNGKSLHVTS
jgi:hypothetical protein